MKPRRARRLALLRLAALAAGIGAALVPPRAAQAGLPEVVAAAKPALVAIGTHSALASPRFGFRGSGFVVGQGNWVVTSAHVLPDTLADHETLVLQTGTALADGSAMRLEWRSLKTVALDRDHDLALLRFDGLPLPALTLADAAAGREGQAVALLGFPLGAAMGFFPVTHRGIVAAIAPMQLPPPTAQHLDAAALARLRRPPFAILQLDATAYPGNSGGPVVDADTGQVLGVVSMVSLKAGRESALSSPTGISYAVPVRWVRALIERSR